MFIRHGHAQILSGCGKAATQSLNGNPRRDYTDWLAFLEAVGVNRHRVHDARHNAATFLLEAEVDVKVVAEILGHSKRWFTRDTYQHVSQRLQAQAAEQIAATLLAGPSGQADVGNGPTSVARAAASRPLT